MFDYCIDEQLVPKSVLIRAGRSKEMETTAQGRDNAAHRIRAI